VPKISDALGRLIAGLPHWTLNIPMALGLAGRHYVDGHDLSYGGSALRRELARLVAVCAVAIGLTGPLAEQALAVSLAGVQSAGRSAQGASVVSKAHGFHCRSVLGWDPVAGVYRYHRHEGICRNYKRCLRQQKRCLFVLGRGFERWSYETFGEDNWRFSRCMIRAGCY